MNAAEIAVLMFLYRRASPSTVAWPSYADIAEHAGLSRRQVVRVIHGDAETITTKEGETIPNPRRHRLPGLVNRGLVKVTAQPGQGGQGVNRYTLTVIPMLKKAEREEATPSAPGAPVNLAGGELSAPPSAPGAPGGVPGAWGSAPGAHGRIPRSIPQSKPKEEERAASSSSQADANGESTKITGASLRVRYARLHQELTGTSCGVAGEDACRILYELAAKGITSDYFDGLATYGITKWQHPKGNQSRAINVFAYHLPAIEAEYAAIVKRQQEQEARAAIEAAQTKYGEEISRRWAWLKENAATVTDETPELIEYNRLCTLCNYEPRTAQRVRDVVAEYHSRQAMKRWNELKAEWSEDGRWRELNGDADAAVEMVEALRTAKGMAVTWDEVRADFAARASAERFQVGPIPDGLAAIIGNLRGAPVPMLAVASSSD